MDQLGCVQEEKEENWKEHYERKKNLAKKWKIMFRDTL